MPRTCVACSHPDQAAIDQAIVSGEPFRRIGTRFEISEASVRRHKRDHLPVAVSKAHEVEEEVRCDDLLDQVRSLHRKTLAILTKAEDADDGRVALGAIREARSTLELLAKMLGLMSVRHEIEQNVNWRFTIGRGYDDPATERTETVEGHVSQVE